MTETATRATDVVLPADRSMVDAQVRSVVGKPGVLAIRALPRWDGENQHRVDGEPVTVVACATPLAVRDALTRRASTPGRLVVLTDLPADVLGDGICDHLISRRPVRPDPWRALRERFSARQQEAALLRNRESAREALRQLSDQAPPPAPGGVLTRDHLLGTLVDRQLHLDTAATTVDLLLWTAEAGADARFAAWWQDTHSDLRDDVFGWLTRSWGPAADGILAGLRHRQPSDLLPLGLIADIADQDEATADRDALITLRARLENLVGVTALSDQALRGWARSAVLAADRLTAGGGPLLATVQRRADVLAAELRIGGLAERSEYLPAALELRIDTFAATAGGDLEELESAWNRIAEHVSVAGATVADWPREVTQAQAVIRLLRYSAQPAFEPADLAATVDWYRSIGSWVDTAVNGAFVGSDHPRLAEVAHRVVQQVRSRRQEQDRAAARLLAAGGTYRPAGDTGPLMIEDVLQRVVLPLTAVPPGDWITLPSGPNGMPNSSIHDGPDRAPVLLVVADGMSAANANDLLVDIGRRHASTWQHAQLRGPDGAPIAAALAALPTVTGVSRCSLLSGRISSGDQNVERRQFDNWLSAHSLGSRKQTLFHKADIAAVAAGHALPQSVRDAIDDTIGRPIVACVLNTIDDALDRSDPIATRWNTVSVRPLDALLQAAARVGRIVVLTSDHGHVVERREQPTRQRGDAVSARWRPAPTGVQAADDEVLVQGERVVTDNGQAVLAVGEQIRYSALKAGYHGGAALAEVVVPVALLVPGEIPEYLPLMAGGSVPTWWVGADSMLAATGPASAVKSAPRRPERRSKAVEPGLFDEPPAPVEPVGSGRKAGTDRIGRLLRSRQFEINHARFAPQLDADQIARLLRSVIAAGGSLPRPQAAAVLGVADRRLPGALAVIGQMLNIDGVVALGQTATEVTVVEGLLYEQFGIAP